MSELVVKRNGKLVGKGLESLAETLSLPEGDTSDRSDEMAVQLLEALRGKGLNLILTALWQRSKRRSPKPPPVEPRRSPWPASLHRSNSFNDQQKPSCGRQLPASGKRLSPSRRW